MKNTRLPGSTACSYLMSQILDPKTWTRKRNFDRHQGNLALLAEAIKGTCYADATPNQVVFYTKDEIKLIGTKLVSETEVVDEQGVRFFVDAKIIVAEDGGKLWSAGFDAWRQIRVPRVKPKGQAIAEEVAAPVEEAVEETVSIN